jgi:hypothetical protein
MRREDFSWVDTRRQLLEMVAADSKLRSELAADGSLFQGYHPRMQELHDANASRLALILDQGWPGEPQVGKDGAEAAWLIAQHAIAQPQLQRRALKMLKEAVLRGEASTLHAAMLEDRIRCFEGRPQLFGTQFDWDATGELNPLPIDQPETVDDRRRAIGLGPLAADLRLRREEIATSGEHPPTDWAVRKKEMDAWCLLTGWRS